MRLRTTERWANDLVEEALKGEHTIENGYWIEEDEKTLQRPYLGSDFGVMSSPPRSRVVFSEAEWAVVTLRSRNQK